jgi:GMP synthase-like glutamine amidotransferase
MRDGCKGAGVVCLEHVAFEGPGLIEAWAGNRGLRFTRVEVHNGAKPPRAEDVGMLVIMGGPMSVNEEARYGWLREEKRYVESVIRAGKPVLGVCLGAQMLANVLGARVYPNGEKEIGWFPVTRVGPVDSPRVVAGFPRRFTVFQWHGETFDLPAGASHVARSEACENQAFVYEHRVVGLQFHLEMGGEDVRRLLTNCPEDLTGGRFVRSADRLMDDDNTEETGRVLRQMMDALKEEMRSKEQS